MKIIKGKVKEDIRRDLYWVRIIFLDENKSKKSEVLACFSLEYLKDLSRIWRGERLTETEISKWLDGVTRKWSSLGEDIFNQDVHYDVYTKTEKDEANCLDFLLNKAQSE